MHKPPALLALMASVALSATSASADDYKYQTQMPPGVAAPDSVETRLGTLKFDYGYPDDATARTIYDNLGFQRSVQSYLLALPPVIQAANRNAIRPLGPVNQTVPIFEQLVTPEQIFLRFPGLGWISPRGRWSSRCRPRCSDWSTTCGVNGGGKTSQGAAQ